MSFVASSLAVGYLSAGLLCLAVAYWPPAERVARPAPDEVRRVATLWAGCGFALTLLAVLALWQLDLMLGDVLRQSSREVGWYSLRRPFQAAALVAGLWLAWKVLREALPSGASPLLGCVALTLLLAFVVWGRFVSWHWMDSVLNFRLGGASTGRWLEVSGLLSVAVLAAWQWRRDAIVVTAPPSTTSTASPSASLASPAS